MFVGRFSYFAFTIYIGSNYYINTDVLGLHVEAAFFNTNSTYSKGMTLVEKVDMLEYNLRSSRTLHST